MTQEVLNLILKYYTISKNGDIHNLKGDLLKPYIDKDGYHCFKFTINKVRYHAKVHRIVAILYLPNPENKTEVNHINCIKHDNRSENLEWVTAKENTIHKMSNNLKEYGISFNNENYIVYSKINKHVKKATYIGCFNTLDEAIYHRDLFLNKIGLTVINNKVQINGK